MSIFLLALSWSHFAYKEILIIHAYHYGNHCTFFQSKVHVTIGIATNSTSEIFLSNIQIMFI